MGAVVEVGVKRAEAGTMWVEMVHKIIWTAKNIFWQVVTAYVGLAF